MGMTADQQRLYDQFIAENGVQDAPRAAAALGFEITGQGGQLDDEGNWFDPTETATPFNQGTSADPYSEISLRRKAEEDAAYEAWQATQPPPTTGLTSPPTSTTTGTDRAAREAAGIAALRAAGLDPNKDRGNWESYMSGRANLAEFTKDTQSRATNYTGDRQFNSQDPTKYDSNGNLTPAARAELQARGLPERKGGPLGGSYVGDTRWYPTGGPSSVGPRSGGPSSVGPQSFAQMSSDVGPSPQSIQPFTGEFAYEDFVAPEPRAQAYPGFTQTTKADLEGDPSWKLRLSEAQQALERSAAASGSYLTPNTMQAITRNSQDYASNEFGNVDSRRFRDWTTGYGRVRDEDATSFGNAATTYGLKRGNQADLFNTRRDIFQTNEGNRFNSQSQNQMNNFAMLTGNRNFDFSNRQFDFTRDQDAWSRNRSGYLDDFMIQNKLDNDFWQRQQFNANLGARR